MPEERTGTNNDDIPAPPPIAGNVSQTTKDILAVPLRLLGMRGYKMTQRIFGDAVMSRVVVTEASVLAKVEEPLKKEGRVVCEIVVEEGECSDQVPISAP